MKPKVPEGFEWWKWLRHALTLEVWPYVRKFRAEKTWRLYYMPGPQRAVVAAYAVFLWLSDYRVIDDESRHFHMMVETGESFDPDDTVS